MYLLRGAGSYVIGRGPQAGDSPRTYYFDGDGRPATDQTEEWLRREATIWLFLRRGRLHPLVEKPVVSESQQDWNAYLKSVGLGVGEGLQHWEQEREEQRRDDWDDGLRPSDSLTTQFEDQEEEDFLGREEIKLGTVPIERDSPVSDLPSRPRRSIFAVPRSAWRRALLVRLSVLFDRDPDDALIKRLADYLSRDHDWHEWWYDRSLDPLRAEIAAEPWRRPLISALEAVAFNRARIAWSRSIEKEPACYSFRLKDQTYEFTVPRGHPGEGQKKLDEKAFAVWMLAVFKGSRIPDEALRTSAFAAVTWIARRFITKPSAWASKTPRLADVAGHFGLPERRVRYAASRITSGLKTGLVPIQEILSTKPGRKPVRRPRVGPATLLNSAVARSPEGQAAVRLIEEASQIEHGWSSSPDLTAKPPTPAEKRKANRLRKRGFDTLRRLWDEAERP
jgi:hypothetical protein